MSSFHPPPNPLGPPSRQPPPPRPRGSGALGVFFTLSFLLNVVLVLLVCGGLALVLFVPEGPETSLPLKEKLYAGSASATDRVAVVQVDCILLEGALDFVHRQVETASEDEDDKAVVVRINSPGGSVTSSDDLHR